MQLSVKDASENRLKLIGYAGIKHSHKITFILINIVIVLKIFPNVREILSSSGFYVQSDKTMATPHKKVCTKKWL